MNNEPSIDELLPCPFCGSDEVYTRWHGSAYEHGDFTEDDNVYYFVQCDKCGAKSGAVPILHDDCTGDNEWDNQAALCALLLWNTRKGVANGEATA